ncbi:hypothetical protein Hanom_Chr05g00410111 [Helianthus anomalus]
MFQSKVESLSSSSEWALWLANWNDKLTDLVALSSDSSDSDDESRHAAATTVSQKKQTKTYKSQRVGESSSASDPPRTSSVEVVSDIASTAAVISVVTARVSTFPITTAIHVPSSVESVFLQLLLVRHTIL